jgi:hypothetical protein
VPTDPRIPLGAVAQMSGMQVESPMQLMSQMYQLQQHQEQQEMARQRLLLQQEQLALEQQEAGEKAETKRRVTAAGAAMSPYLRKGGTGSIKDFDVDQYIGSLAPELQNPARAIAQEWDTAEADLASKAASARKTLEEAGNLRLAQLGKYARQIRSAKYDPTFSQGVLSLIAKHNPEFDPDAIWAEHGQNPQLWQRYVDSLIEATGEDVTLSGGAGAPDVRVGPTGAERARGLEGAPPKPDLVEEYNPQSGQTVKRYVTPTVGATFLQPPPQAAGGEAVNRQLQKVVDPVTGQIVYAGFNPRTNKFEKVETSYQPEQNVSEEIPVDWRTAFGLATANLSRDKRENEERLFNQAFINTPADKRGEAFKTIVRNAAIISERPVEQTNIMSRAQMATALTDVEKGLQELQDAGIPTDWFNGTVYDLQRRLGSGTPEQVRLGVRLNTMLSTYTKAMSGVQFSEEEAKRYKTLFPNYKNSFVVNIAAIQGLRDDMMANDRTYWEGKLGKDGARLIGIPEGSFTLRGSGQTSTTQPQEGQRTKSKSGRAMIFRGGQWVYE